MPFPFDNEQTIGILSNATARIGGTPPPIVPPQDKQNLTDGIDTGGIGRVVRFWKPSWPEITILGGGLGPGIQDYAYDPHFYVPEFGLEDWEKIDWSTLGHGGGGGGGTGTYPPGDDQAERKSFKGKYFKDVVEDITHSDPDDPCNEKNRANWKPHDLAVELLDTKYNAIRGMLSYPPSDIDSPDEWVFFRDLLKTVVSAAMGGASLVAGVLFDSLLGILSEADTFSFQKYLLIRNTIDLMYRIERLELSILAGRQGKTKYDGTKWVYPCPDDQAVDDELMRNLSLLMEQYNILVRSIEFIDEEKPLVRRIR